jgi:outer membrane immunogenic protein
VTRIPFAIAIAAAALSITPAAAADLGRFPPQARFYPPTPMLRVYNWTGCYLGGQLGGAFANNHINGQVTTSGSDPVTGNPTNTAVMTTNIDQNAGSTAVIAGGQGGCDLQFARNWVIGAQLDGAWTHLNGSQAVSASTGLPEQGSMNLSANAIVQANIIATATGRIGWAANFDDIAGLFYLKGGAAFINYDTYRINGQSSIISCAAFDPKSGCTAFNSPVNTAVNFTAPSASRWGWTIGLGTEWVVDGNWSIFGEWDFLNFANHNVTFTDANFGSTQFSARQSINEVKVGVNYRFGNPLPQQYP